MDIESARFFSDINEIEGVGTGGAVTSLFGTFMAEGIAAGARAAILIRPQGIRPAADGCFEALVTESRFLGDDTECQLLVQAPGVELTLLARIPAGLAPPRGETRRFSIDPNHVMVFPSP